MVRHSCALSFVALSLTSGCQFMKAMELGDQRRHGAAVQRAAEPPTEEVAAEEPEEPPKRQLPQSDLRPEIADLLAVDVEPYRLVPASELVHMLPGGEVQAAIVSGRDGWQRLEYPDMIVFFQKGGGRVTLGRDRLTNPPFIPDSGFVERRRVDGRVVVMSKATRNNLRNLAGILMDLEQTGGKSIQMACRHVPPNEIEVRVGAAVQIAGGAQEPYEQKIIRLLWRAGAGEYISAHQLFALRRAVIGYLQAQRDGCSLPSQRDQQLHEGRLLLRELLGLQV